MSSEEKSVWVQLVLAIGTYTAYLIIVLGRAASTPLTEVDYAPTLLWTIGVSIVASIVVTVVVGMFSPRDAGKKDQRDKQISRFGEYTGHWFLVAGALAALLMALVQFDQFWIANVIYLAFVLSMILSSVVKIVAYRRGIQSW
jgi:cell division protein FtsW (lipid II flippase)